MSKIDEKFKELGQRFMDCLTFRLSQDGVTADKRIAEMFGNWISAKVKRIGRYEAGDMKLVDEFIDYAWARIKDPDAPLPRDREQPTPAAARFAAVPAVARATPRTPANNAIDWHAVYEQLHARDRGRGLFEQEQAQRAEAAQQAWGLRGQQWVVLDQNGNLVNR